jgi:universal stress protein E
VATVQLRKIFCVIDPTTNRQRALERAAWVAGRSRACVHAYLCFPGASAVPADDREEYLAAERRRHELWLEALLAPFRSEGVEFETEIESADDWRSALIDAAQRASADLIIRATYQRSALQRRVLKTTDWTLLREARCPVLLVKTDQPDPARPVLAAVDIKAKDAPHQKLTETVIEYAKAVAAVTGAELHAVNAYQGEMNFVHPPDLAKRLGIERRQAHVGNSAPEDLITEIAGKLGTPLVVIGSLARRGMSGAVVGNTAERILDQIQSDILCIIRQP